MQQRAKAPRVQMSELMLADGHPSVQEDITKWAHMTHTVIEIEM